MKKTAKTIKPALSEAQIWSMLQLSAGNGCFMNLKAITGLVFREFCHLKELGYIERVSTDPRMAHMVTLAKAGKVYFETYGEQG